MAVEIGKLKVRWAWTTLLGFVVLAAMGALESHIKRVSGYGLMDLEVSTTAALDNRIVGAWLRSGAGPMVGFLIGVDYLFMAIYAVALSLSGLVAREAFAREPGRGRRILSVLALAPFAAAAFDVLENAFEARMLFEGAVSPQLACLATAATATKFVFFAVGVGLLLAALAGLKRT